MNTTKKIFVIAAVCCILLGTCLTYFALRKTGFDLSKLSAEEITMKTYDIRDEFKNIEINAVECDVSILPSSDGESHVVCSESEKIINDVRVENGSLIVDRRSNRKWYELFGLFGIKDISITVYLPERQYDFIHLKTVSGEIKTSNDFEFSRAEIYTTSGDVSFTSKKCGDLFVKTTSGDIEVIGVDCDNAEFASASGDVDISGLNADGIRIKTTSGEVETQSVILSGEASVETVSGDATIMDSDAKSIIIRTTSGDVCGKLLSPKIFVTDTSSGNVNTSMSNPDGGECRVETVSGDIRVTAPER